MFRSTHFNPGMKGALVVSACVPVPEALRSSLQSHLSTNQSKALYRRFLLDILDTTQDVEGMDFYLAYSPRGCRNELSRIAPSQFKLLCAEGKGQGEQLSRLYARLMKAGYERVIVLCSSHPDLPACLLHQAVEALDRDRVDMVLGPNERGRHYLLGMKEHRASLFTAVDWNGGETGEQITRWARERKVRLHRLPAWYDIHTIDDLRRHLRYYSLRQGKTAMESRRLETGEYLLQIQENVPSLNC